MSGATRISLFTQTGTVISPVSGTRLNITSLGVTNIIPTADGTTAIQFFKADGTTAVIDYDTTNQQLKLRQVGADATGYASQRSSGIFNFETSMWNGSSQEKGNFSLQSIPLTASQATSLTWKYGSTTILELSTGGRLTSSLLATSTSTPAENFRMKNTNATIGNYTSLNVLNANDMRVAYLAFKNQSHSATVGSTDFEIWLANGAAATKQWSFLKDNKFVGHELGTATVGTTTYNSPDIILKSSAWDTDGSVADTHTWTVRNVPTSAAVTFSELKFFSDINGTPTERFAIRGTPGGSTYARISGDSIDAFLSFFDAAVAKWSVGYDKNPSGNYFISSGEGATNTRFSLTTAGLLALGNGTTSSSYDIGFGLSTTNGNKTIGVERQPTAATAGRALTINAGGAYSGGTDLAGGDTYIASGISTGTGYSRIYFQTATPGSTGTSDNTPTTKMMLMGNGFLGINTETQVSRLETNGSVGYKVTTLNAATLTLDDTHYFIAVTYTATGAVTITLPSAASAWNSTSGVGRRYVISDAGALAGTNNITIARAGSDTITDTATGGTSKVITGNGDTIEIQAISASVWKIL